MKKHLSKKRVVLAAIVTVALALASGVAYAYFTSSGTGNASATVGSDAGLTVAQVLPGPSNILPNGSTHAINVRVTNSASFQQSLKALAISVDATALATSAPGCDSAWFTVGSPTISDPIVLDANGGTTDLSGTIAMNPSSEDQDACKGADIPLNLVAS